jgi:signal transduction histidine kinase
MDGGDIRRLLRLPYSRPPAISARLAGAIYTEVNRLSSLVGRFLDFARPSQLNIRAEDLPALLQRCIKAVTEQCQTAKIKIVKEYAPSLPRALVDAEVCEQVFTNLISNACEAMSEGGQLTIRIYPAQNSPGSAGEVAVQIADSGPGVPEEMKEQIFNPFYTTKKSGVGLGLAIVSKIVDAHGGTVKLVSAPGQGACFRVTLPAETKVRS